MFLVKNFSRIKQLVGILFSYELYAIIDALKLKSFLPFHQRFEEHNGKVHLSPKKARKLLEELGGAFSKLGQLLALRPDLIGKEYSKEFEKLLDNSNPLPLKEIKDELHHIPYSKIEAKPIGSASVAQVHKAILDGKEVAIKVKRPGIDELFRADIEIMEHLAKKLTKRLGKKVVDTEEIVQEFKTYTQKELNFRHEATNIKRFQRNFSQSKSIRIPKVYDQYSTKNVLVMEYQKGTSILNASKKDKTIVKKVTDTVYKMLFEDRFFHADLHSGNILYNKGKIILLDFGIVGHIDKDFEKKLFLLFRGLVQGDIEQTAEALLEINTSDDIPNEDVLRNGIYEVLGDYYNTSLAKMNFEEIFYGSIDVARKAHIRIPGNLVLFGKSLVTMEGFCKQINPEFNVVQNARPYVKKKVAQEKKPALVAKKMKDTSIEMFFLLESLPKAIKTANRRVNSMERKVADIDATFHDLISIIWRTGQLIVVSVLFATFLLAGLLLRHTSPYVAGTSIYTVFTFIAAVIFLIRMIQLLDWRTEK